MINRFLVLMILLPVLAMAQTTLFSETFANGVLENPWYPGFEGASNAMDVKSVSSPSGDNWVGVLGNELSRSASLTYSGDENLNDFYLEAKIYVETDSAFYYGLEFRIDTVGIDKGYNFVVQPNPIFGPTRIRFRKRVGTMPTSIKDWPSALIPGIIPTNNGWHTMGVSAVGDQFRLFFDEQELPDGPFTDTTWTNGFIGAYVFDMDTNRAVHLKIDDILVQSVPTSIDPDKKHLSSDFNLYQNYPNPFNPTTQISFKLPSSEFVQLEIYNLIGQKVRTLLNENQSAGIHQLTWDARDDAGNELPAGIYYYQLKSANFQQTRKMLLVK